MKRPFLFLSLSFTFCLSENISTSKCGEKEKSLAQLEVCREFIKEAKSLYYDCAGSDCAQKEQYSAFLDIAWNTLSLIKTKNPNCREPVCPEFRPMDCGEILQWGGKKESGVYTIWPKTDPLYDRPLTVYCDMDTDGGGWTVIQRRGKFSTPKDFFYKDWANYKKGFGNLTEEFWIGNGNIYGITNQANYSIRFHLKNAKGENGYAKYNTFRIEDEAAGYKLHIDGYSGNVGHALMMNDNMKFSTRDRRNDQSTSSCAVEYKGAWWYNQCTSANLNGLYQPGIVSDESAAWYHWKTSREGLAWIEMKLRS